NGGVRVIGFRAKVGGEVNAVHITEDAVAKHRSVSGSQSVNSHARPSAATDHVSRARIDTANQILRTSHVNTVVAVGHHGRARNVSTNEVAGDDIVGCV